MGLLSLETIRDATTRSRLESIGRDSLRVPHTQPSLAGASGSRADLVASWPDRSRGPTCPETYLAVAGRLGSLGRLRGRLKSVPFIGPSRAEGASGPSPGRVFGRPSAAQTIFRTSCPHGAVPGQFHYFTPFPLHHQPSKPVISSGSTSVTQPEEKLTLPPVWSDICYLYDHSRAVHLAVC